MLNRNQGSRLRCETTKAGVDALVRPASVGGYPREVALFVAIVVQFGLIVLVMRDWQLENVLLYRLMDLAFVGFIIHHLLLNDCLMLLSSKTSPRNAQSSDGPISTSRR